jgi:hypothetical protein
MPPKSPKLIDLKILHFAPLAPQFWGELEPQSPPELGDLGGKIASLTNQKTCVYTVAFLRGVGGIEGFQTPLRERNLTFARDTHITQIDARTHR